MSFDIGLVRRSCVQKDWPETSAIASFAIVRRVRDDEGVRISIVVLRWGFQAQGLRVCHIPTAGKSSRRECSAPYFDA